MMHERKTSTRAIGAFMLASAVLLAGCEEDPIAGADGEPEVGGFLVMDGATELYRYTEDDASPDTLFLTSNETTAVTFVWLDFDSEPITLEEGLSLVVESNSPGLASFEATGGTGATGGTITAGDVAASVTTAMRVRLFHEQEGHYDFTSLFFPVTVAP